MKSNIWYPYDRLPSSPVRREKRGDAGASEASRNAAGELGKPPCGSPTRPLGASKPLDDAKGIAYGLPPAELPGYAIIRVPYVGFHPLGALSGKTKKKAPDPAKDRAPRIVQDVR